MRTKSGVNAPSSMPRYRDVFRFGRFVGSAAAASIIVWQAWASGAGRVGSLRNFFVVKPTKPKPISAPAKLKMISEVTSTGGTSSPLLR